MTKIIVDRVYKASVSGLFGNLYLEGDERGLTARYLPNTKLGKRLTNNTGNICEVLSNYIRQELNLPRGDGISTVIVYKACDNLN